MVYFFYGKLLLNVPAFKTSCKLGQFSIPTSMLSVFVDSQLTNDMNPVFSNLRPGILVKGSVTQVRFVKMSLQQKG